MNRVLEIPVSLHQLYKMFSRTAKELFIQSDEFYLALGLREREIFSSCAERIEEAEIIVLAETLNSQPGKYGIWMRQL